MSTVLYRAVIGMAMFVLLALPSGVLAKNMNMPDTVELDSIENLYGKVPFNHSQHVTIAGDCSVCHHHTTGTPVTNPDCARCHKNSGATTVVSCKGCHAAQPFSAAVMRKKNKNAYHIDTLGLKGAYHQCCTGCHRVMGGPTGCQDCHALNKKGAAFYDAGEYAPAKNQGKGEASGH
ncbi:MAG: cytochrome c3 family protein [Geobacteraceae bacterium]